MTEHMRIRTPRGRVGHVVLLAWPAPDPEVWTACGQTHDRVRSVPRDMRTCPKCAARAKRWETSDAYRRIQRALCDVLDVADQADADTRQRLKAAATTISEAAHELRAAKD